MARGLVDRVVVGADRIAANGDVANKVGTYPLAVLADRHGVPFYVAAPVSTIDPARRAAPRSRSRSATRRRWPAGRGLQPRLRRDPGRARQRHLHRGGRARAALRGVDRACRCGLSGGRRPGDARARPRGRQRGQRERARGRLVHITPRALPYPELTEDDLVALSPAGEVLAGSREPSSERRVHLAVYAARPDAAALVHTHSVHATAWSFLGEPLDTGTGELERGRGRRGAHGRLRRERRPGARGRLPWRRSASAPRC